MRQTVSEANKYLRQTVKSVEAGGVATLAQAMEHPGTLQEVHVTTLDAADAEIPAAAGLSEGVKLPTRIETKKLVIVGKFPIATQAEYDALSDAMKDKAVILNVTECPIGSEVKAIECNALGVPVDAHMWIMGADGWKGGSSSTLNPDGSTSLAGPLTALGGMSPVRAGSKGLRMPFFRLANIANDALGYTYQTILSLEQHFDAIQLVIGTLQTSGVIRSAHYCNVIADENLTDAAMNALSGWAFVDWAENDGNGVRAQFASFAATTSRPRLMLSDIKTFNSVDRTDGGAGALLVVRSHLYPDNLTPTLAGNGTTDIFANIARTDGRTMKIRRMVNNGMTAFTGGVDAIQTPLLGVIYYSRGKVVNVVKFGDSIMQGRNSPMGDGYVRPETIRRSDMDGIAWECSDCAWSGLTTGNYHNLAMDILDNANLPIDIAIYPGESPNNIASEASEATALAAVKANRFRLQQFVDKCRTKNVVPIISTFAPVATAVNNYTLCDNVRRDYNDGIVRPYADRNALVIDTDSALAGANVGGQVQPLAGVMQDGIHPSTAGNELIRAKLQPVLGRVTVS